MDYPVREELAQMLLAEWDDEIQTLPANGSHQTFTTGVRSGRPHRRSKYFESESPECVVPIPTKRLSRGHGLGIGMNDHWERPLETAVGPLRCRMSGNVAVQNPATADLHDQQHVQDLEASRDRNQKVAGDDRLSVIVNKGTPMLRRSSPWTLATGLPRPVGTYGSW